MSGALQRLRASKLVSKLSGFDWQLAVAKLIIVALILGTFYFIGRGDGKEACQKEHAKQALQQAKKAKAFAPVVDRQATAAAQQQQRLETKQDRYNEQVDKNPKPSSCDLSPDELRAFQDLVEG